jgi:hypothetical protein
MVDDVVGFECALPESIAVDAEVSVRVEGAAEDGEAVRWEVPQLQ